MSLLYPIFLDLTNRKVVVIGGGHVAGRKVERLIECQANVTLISPQIVPPLQKLTDQMRIELHLRPYQPGDLSGAWLVIAACDDHHVNQQVFDEANRRHIFCNVVDDPPRCSFQVPALVQRDPLQIAIFTGGAGPALAKKIRQQLEQIFPEYYQEFLDALAKLRRRLKEKYPENQPQRAAILSAFLESKALKYLENQQTDAFQNILQEYLDK